MSNVLDMTLEDIDSLNNDYTYPFILTNRSKEALKITNIDDIRRFQWTLFFLNRFKIRSQEWKQ